MSLVGTFIHTYEGVELCYQGCIVGVTDTHALVQLFSFLSGDPTAIRVLPLEDIENWKMYADQDSMLDAYDVYSGGSSGATREYYAAIDAVRRAPTPASALKQHTYLIGVEDGDKVKIGRAVDPQKRVRELQTGNAETLVVLVLIDTPEASLHQRFAHLRVRGEWFHRDAELNAFIAEHATTPTTKGVDLDDLRRDPRTPCPPDRPR